MPRISVRPTEDEYDAIREMASEKEVSMNRLLIDRALAAADAGSSRPTEDVIRRQIAVAERASSLLEVVASELAGLRRVAREIENRRLFSFEDEKLEPLKEAVDRTARLCRTLSKKILRQISQ